MFSALKLGDRWLNLFDIFNLQLGADLTTLSACETGMSGIWEGDELLGLAAGFLYAGTPSLVVSLWTVNDRSTADLMRHFYEGLQNGLAKSRALRDAILHVKDAYPHPYYWAAFVLTGMLNVLFGVKVSDAQPDEADWKVGGYANNGVQRVPVLVV